MAKQSNRQSSKTSSKTSATHKVNNPRTGRSAVMTPKSGATVDRRRVKNGGEYCW